MEPAALLAGWTLLARSDPALLNAAGVGREVFVPHHPMLSERCLIHDEIRHRTVRRDRLVRGLGNERCRRDYQVGKQTAEEDRLPHEHLLERPVSYPFLPAFAVRDCRVSPRAHVPFAAVFSPCTQKPYNLSC